MWDRRDTGCGDSLISISPSAATINACDLGHAGPATGARRERFRISAARAAVRRLRSGNPYASYYVMQENSTGKSNYNSLQASLRVNSWHG